MPQAEVGYGTVMKGSAVTVMRPEWARMAGSLLVAGPTGPFGMITGTMIVLARRIGGAAVAVEMALLWPIVPGVEVTTR